MLESVKPKKAIRQIKKRVHVFRKGAKNTLELLREGRLGAPYKAAFAVLYEDPVFKLRRYLPGDAPSHEPGKTILLVPPLMVASEIYDISPELSAVSWLVAQGVDVWLVDFGEPKSEKYGLQRTLDDHVDAVSIAVDKVRELTGEKVHLAGYSQGGMFAYQCAAYRESEGLASVITFGSPVDIHRNIPNVNDDIAGRIVHTAGRALTKPLEHFEGLPGSLTSKGFKMLSASKEVKQMLGIFKILHDREALEQRERRRRFLAGEGFVSWPGPALHEFVREMVINNRMLSGGIVIKGKTISLSEITCPVLYFVGSRDDFGRPPSVRAIRNAAVNADIHEVELHAGHFGLVVGSKSLRITWPSVVTWMGWVSGKGELPDSAPEKREEREADSKEDGNLIAPLYDFATDILDGLWHRLGDVSLEVSEMLDIVRWQLPRMAQIRQLENYTRVSIGRILQEQAESIPKATFFLWKGSAFTYAQANQRVNQILSGIIASDLKPGEHVGIFMSNHPDYLTTVAALNRLNAIAVLLNAEARGESLKHAIEAGKVQNIIIDPNHIAAMQDLAFAGKCWVLGKSSEPLPSFMESLDDSMDSEDEELLSRYPLNSGIAEDVALLIFTSGTTGLPKAVKITNRRWSIAALATAASATITSKDTVYCCLPLYHSTGMLVAVGGALVGGARLALAPRFSTTTFWNEVRRYGVTIVGYVGEMCRYLINMPPNEHEKQHSIRLFAGSGMQKQVWKMLVERFAPERVMEFYASSEGNAILANLSGEKIGSVGQPLSDSSHVELIRYDINEDQIDWDDKGKPQRCDPEETGLLIAKIDETHPLGYFDGYAEEKDTNQKILNNLFKKGDAWFVTGDLLKRDAEGDFWFVDRLGDTFRWKGENVSTQQVSAVISQVPFVGIASVYGVTIPGREGRVGVVALELKPGTVFDGNLLFQQVEENLSQAARPRVIRIVSRIETTGTYKFIKYSLQKQGVDPEQTDDALYLYDLRTKTYRLMHLEDYPEAID
ncbi:alpha/beta fold hydrolase [Deltaproteobacteria bacterium TL4]